MYEGMFYRHYDVPKYAIVTEDKKEMVSAKTCRKIGAHYECQIQKGPCDVNEYKNCNTVMNRVTDNVVAIELGDATFIATTTQVNFRKVIIDTNFVIYRTITCVRKKIKKEYIRLSLHPATSFFKLPMISILSSAAKLSKSFMAVMTNLS